MNKYAAINTPDHRLAMMGFSHPDSTQTTKYINHLGDNLQLRGRYEFGRGWYWIAGGVMQYYNYSKRRVIAQMEASGRYK